MKHWTNARALFLVAMMAGTSLSGFGCATTQGGTMTQSEATPIGKAERKIRKFEKYGDPQRQGANDSSGGTSESP
jgi:hypothetical protein